MRKQVGEFWFSQGHEPFYFGVVVTEEMDGGDKGKRTAYIAALPQHEPGEKRNECSDVKFIRDFGDKLIASHLREILNLLDGKKEMATDHDHGGKECES